MSRLGNDTVRGKPGGSAADSETVGWFGRVGLATSGVIYLLIGILAIRIAFGFGNEEADQKGAIETIGRQPFGKVMLPLLVIGFVVLAVWYAAKAYKGGKVGDGHSGGTKTRIGLAASSIFSATLAVTTLRVTMKAFEEQKPEAGGGEKEKEAVAAVLDWPGGKFIVFAAAIYFVYWGGKMLKRAIKKDYMEQFAGLRQTRRKVVDPLGRAGFTAQAVVRWVAAWFLVKAAMDHDAEKTVGLDGALRELADQSYGPWLLVAVALGMAAFGIFRLFDAAWRSDAYL
jgi:hypothetical protein